jgi:hypothetical protein
MNKLPITLLSMLNELKHQNIYFIIDNNISMLTPLTTSYNGLSAYFKSSSKICYTRWNETEDNLYLLLEVLSFIHPTSIHISYDTTDSYFYYYGGYSFDTIYHDLHTLFRKIIPTRETKLPIEKNFIYSWRSSLVYLFTDVEFLYNNLIPMTIITSGDCTKTNTNITSIGSYIHERNKFHTIHGDYVNYTISIWIICVLCSAIHPTQLDLTNTLSKETIYLLTGTIISDKDYKTIYLKQRKQNGYKIVNDNKCLIS